ncbi:MAG: OmpH family outer membrane protein [Nitrospirae bacterium]|nr:OmpH family outer membrane protein [Nitrospirota bacterium]
MKTKFIICILLLVTYNLLFNPFSYAAESTKIGYIDLQRVVYESEAGKKAKSELDALVKSKQAIVDEKRHTLERLKSDLEKQASVLSPEARKAKQDEIEKMEREYLRLAQDSETELRKKDSELKETIVKEIFELLDKIGKEEGYTLILDKSMFIYGNKELDITNMVIKKYNESKAGLKKR